MKPLRWLMRRWVEFRWGWMYISYIVSGINFITITYYLLIQDLGLDIPLWLYALIIANIIPLITVSIGHFYHRRRQLYIDIHMIQEPAFKEIRRIIREELHQFFGGRDEESHR